MYPYQPGVVDTGWRDRRAGTRPERRPSTAAPAATRPWHTGLDRRGDATLLRLCGHLDLLVSSELRQLLNHALRRHPDVIIDLSQVRLIDSTTLGALIGGQNQALEAGGHVCLVAPNPAVRRLLATTRLDGHFPTFDTCDDAGRWCREQRPGAVEHPADPARRPVS